MFVVDATLEGHHRYTASFEPFTVKTGQEVQAVGDDKETKTKKMIRIKNA